MKNKHKHLLTKSRTVHHGKARCRCKHVAMCSDCCVCSGLLICTAELHQNEINEDGGVLPQTLRAATCKLPFVQAILDVLATELWKPVETGDTCRFLFCKSKAINYLLNPLINMETYSMDSGATSHSSGGGSIAT